MAKQTESVWRRILKAIISWQGLLAIALTIGAWWYIAWSFDLIPDITPIFGYTDDAILVGTSLWGWIQAVKHFSNKPQYQKIASGKSYGSRLLKAIFSWPGIISVFLTFLASSYFLGKYDLIPDVIPVAGYLDDVIVVGGIFLLILKLMIGFMKKKAN